MLTTIHATALLVLSASLAAPAVAAPGAQEGWTPPPTPPLVPSPMFADPGWAGWTLPDEIRVVTAEPELAPLTSVVAEHLTMILGRPVPVGEAPVKAGDVILTLGYLPEEIRDNPEANSIEIFGDHLACSGTTPTGVARASARMLQLLSQDPESGAWSLPPVRVDDAPVFGWRGLMVDLARFPHPVESVEDTIDLAYLACLNRVHLHLSDDQAFTFPTSLLPARTDPGMDGANRGYTRAQIQHLVEYAFVRGITLVPEIDMPSHASSLVRARPDLFGTVDPETGEPKGTGVINMASERAYGALGTLLDEVVAAFPTSPVIHLGGDEVWAPHLVDCAEFPAFASANGIPATAEEGAVPAMLNVFLRRVTEMVRERGRRPALWEGFHPGKTEDTSVGRDVLVFAWSQNSQTPEALLEAGYEIVNCGWDPLYVVPAQGWAASPEAAFDWDPRIVRQRFGGRVASLGSEARVAGSQICVWEQRPEAIVPALVPTLPLLSERMWGSHAPAEKAGDVLIAADIFRGIASTLLRPVSATWTGTLESFGTAFDGEVTVRLASKFPGTIRYELSDGVAGSPVTEESAAFGAKPFTLKDSKTITAALYGDGGERLGGTTRIRFDEGTPVLTFEAFDLPDGGDLDWATAFGGDPLGTGVLTRTTPSRIAAINRELFARVDPRAHVDTRPLAWKTVGAETLDASRPRLWGRHALTMQGQVTIDRAGEWSIRIKSRNAGYRMYLGSLLIAESTGGEEMTPKGELQAGTYAVFLNHAMMNVHDDLQVELIGPGDAAGTPLDAMLSPLAEHKDASDLVWLKAFGEVR